MSASISKKAPHDDVVVEATPSAVDVREFTGLRHADHRLIAKLQAQLGPTIKKLRRRRGMLQQELARKSKLHPNCLCRIESGKKLPSLAQLYLLARELKTEAVMLLPEVEDLEAADGTVKREG